MDAAGTPPTHGVREFRRSPDAAAVHAEQVELVGYTVVPQALALDTVERARTRIDAIYEEQQGELGGLDALREINDADIARCLVAYDDLFVEMAATEAVLDIVRALLEENVVLMSQNGIINRP